MSGCENMIKIRKSLSKPDKVKQALYRVILKIFVTK